MILKIFKLDNDTKPLCTLTKGEHTFGKGGFLQCTDLRVPQNLGTLTVGDHTATITSTHFMCCCYYQSFVDSQMVILPRYKPRQLSDGDRFALFPDSYWFSVKIEDCEADPSNPTTETVENKASLPNGDTKRKLSTECLENDSPQSKKVCESNDDPREDEPNVQSSNSAIANNSNVSPCSSRSIPETNEEENEPSTVSTNADETANLDCSKEEEKEEPVPDVAANHTNIPDNNVASTSKKRQRCWYTDTCYRKNPLHRKEFSHPDDDDYDKDDRPSCSYGTACYRRNRKHQTEYKHNGPNTNDHQPPRITRKRADRKGHKDDTNDSEDDYDLEDPFIDDGSDFELSNDNSSSDDSDEPADDSDVNKRLVKEALRFLKRK